jgi:hypothetical protein
MHTLILKVNDRIYDKLLGLLSKFSKDEVEVISEKEDFAKDQKYLVGELNEILDNKANFIAMEEAEQRLENVIKKHENSI